VFVVRIKGIHINVSVVNITRSHLLLVLLISSPSMAIALHLDSLRDSSVIANVPKKSQIKFTTRLHSLGVFGYGGMIANSSPSFDVNINYSRKQLGVFAFKAIDFFDSQSSYNFMLVVLYRHFHVTRRITFTPQFGFLMEQCKTFADEGSDGVIFLITSYKINNEVTLEHCARLSNTIRETEFFDWLNRFRFLYTHDHIDFSTTVWHNNNVFDNTRHTSFGLSIAYARIPISKSVQLGTSLTAIKMVTNTDKEELQTGSGLSFSIFATLVR
jgi:hypothetical protein